MVLLSHIAGYARRPTIPNAQPVPVRTMSAPLPGGGSAGPDGDWDLPWSSAVLIVNDDSIHCEIRKTLLASSPDEL